MVVRRNSTTERLAVHPWGPHTHQLWHERRRRRKAKVSNLDARKSRFAARVKNSNDVIENETHVIVFVGGIQARDKDPVRLHVTHMTS